MKYLFTLLIMLMISFAYNLSSFGVINHDNFYLNSEHQAQLMETNKKSYIFYYALDTKEPSFQDAVTKDEKELIESCIKDVNWVFFKNSLKNKFITCEDGILNKKTFLKKDYYDDLKSELTSGNDIQLSHRYFFKNNCKEDECNAYEKYPYVSEVFLYKAIQISNKVFSPSKYIPHIHIKSHGDTDTILNVPYDLISSTLDEQIDIGGLQNTNGGMHGQRRSYSLGISDFISILAHIRENDNNFEILSIFFEACSTQVNLPSSELNCFCSYSSKKHLNYKNISFKKLILSDKFLDQRNIQDVVDIITELGINASYIL